MKNHLFNKMQALPASFFTALCGLIIVMMFFVMQTGASLAVYADTSLSLSDNVKRISLIKQAVRAPQSLKIMEEADIAVLLKTPSLKRNEMNVTAWHYHGNSCSLAIYFSKGRSQPEYLEYRALSMNAAVQEQFEAVDESSLNQYCIKDVLEVQGVNTPSNYARQPTPTWGNPYRT